MKKLFFFLIFQALNFVKLPLPALGINGVGEVRGNAVELLEVLCFNLKFSDCNGLR